MGADNHELRLTLRNLSFRFRFSAESESGRYLGTHTKLVKLNVGMASIHETNTVRLMLIQLTAISIPQAFDAPQQAKASE